MRTLVAERIGARLSQLGLNPHAAAIQAELAPDAVRNILSGKSRNPRGDTLTKIARVLQCDPGYLLGVLDSPKPISDAWHGTEKRLPIRGQVAAGAWLATDDIAQEEPVLAPALIDGDAPQWLERVNGDSMDRLIPPGALIHVLDAIALGYVPRHGDLVVVVRRRAQGAFLERSLKQIAINGAGAVELWPRSHNPRWSTPLSPIAGAEGNDDVVVEIAGKVVRAYLEFG